MIAGVIGFFSEASFASNARGSVFGVLAVNGWHNVVHLLTGALGIVAARTLGHARTYCLIFGIVYLVVCIWGFIAGTDGSVISVGPVNTADNILHLLLAFGGFAAYAASEPRAAPRGRRTASG